MGGRWGLSLPSPLAPTGPAHRPLYSSLAGELGTTGPRLCTPTRPSPSPLWPSVHPPTTARSPRPTFHSLYGRLVILLFLRTTNSWSPYKELDSGTPNQPNIPGEREEEREACVRLRPRDQPSAPPPPCLLRSGRLVILLCSSKNNISLASLPRHSNLI